MSIFINQSGATASTISGAYNLMNAVLDPNGWICIVGIGSDARAIQRFFKPADYQGAIAQAMAFDRDDKNSFFCTSTLQNGTSRKAENVYSMRTFKIDLDIATDDPHKYASKRNAIKALIDFCDSTGIPRPAAVDSGNGVHAYWPLTDALSAEEGKQYSEKFKSVCIAHGLKIDPSVTGDNARLLRVPGTSNRKNPACPKPVKLKTEVIVNDLDSMLDLIDRLFEACNPQRVPSAKILSDLLDRVPIPDHLRNLKVDEATRNLAEGNSKCFAHILKRSQEGTGCAQLLDIYEQQATTKYERWRSGLSIAAFCTDSQQMIHEISKGHPDYSPEQTVRKAADVGGPHHCTTFETQRPELCNGCQHKGRITSPISLGIESDALTENALTDAIAVVREAVILTRAGDVGAPLERNVIDSLRLIKNNNRAEFQRLRVALKEANHNVSLKEIDNQLTDGLKDDPRNASSLLVNLARQSCKFFHDADKEPYATFSLDGHRECWHLRSNGFNEWLSHQAYKEAGMAPAEAAMTTALNTLVGQAKFEGEEKPVEVRVAKHGDDYYIDLCDKQWQAVCVTSTGWQVIQEPPVMFVRTGSMRPLPSPVAGGRIEALWKYANIEPADQLLVLAWMIEAFRPDTPYPVLELFAEQGTAKSSTQSFIRQLIDPNSANIRAKPKAVQDLFVTAKASHITSLDNLSYLASEYQDALCSLATGSGYGGRQLYTNADENVFQVKRPIMLNGISICTTQQDLMDRTLLINVAPITQRRTEGELQTGFEQQKPQIFGALLDLFAGALSVLPTVKIAPADLPRMADFACFGEALFRSMGKPAGEFMTRYHAKRKHGVLQIIDANPVAAALMKLLESNPAGFSGTAKQLNEKLIYFKLFDEKWPRSDRAFGDSLRRAAPGLRMLGYTVNSLGHMHDGYHWQVGW